MDRGTESSFALLWRDFFVAALILMVPGAAMAGVQCRSCECRGMDTTPMTITGRQVTACLAAGKRVELHRVVVIGDIDLARLRPLKLEARGARIPGASSAREAFRIGALEQDLARLVDAAVVVRAPLYLTESVLDGSLRSEPPSSPLFVGPPVFLDTLSLRGTEVKGTLSLQRAVFRSPAIFQASNFRGRVDLRGALFEDNALFDGARIGNVLQLLRSHFARDASFTSIQFMPGSNGIFAQARFTRGASFHEDASGEPATLRNVNFQGAEFGGPGEFQKARVIGDAHFEKIRARDGLLFARAQFSEGQVRFVGATVDGGINFDDAKFDAEAHFSRARFLGAEPASFDRANFERELRFQLSRFEGPVTMVKAQARDIVSFIDAEVRGLLDLRHARIAGLAVGGEMARGRIGGDALFDYAHLERAAFDNTAFHGRASFVGARLGQERPCGSEDIAASFANALFQGVGDFRGATVHGTLNIANLSAEAGAIHWRWDQLQDRVRAVEMVRLQPEAAEGRFCLEPTRDPPPEHLLRRQLADAHLIIERNFKKLDQAEDAAEAAYVRRDWETLSLVGVSGATLWQRARAHMTRWVWGWAGGYGVKPARIALEIVVLLLVLAVAVALSRRPLLLDANTDKPFHWESTGLPWQEQSKDGSVSAPLWLRALWVSLATITPIRIHGAYLVASRFDKAYWLLVVGRILGVLLSFVLAYSLVNVMPLLHKLLGWLPGF